MVTCRHRDAKSENTFPGCRVQQLLQAIGVDAQPVLFTVLLFVVGASGPVHYLATMDAPHPLSNGRGYIQTVQLNLSLVRHVAVAQGLQLYWL
jgi:hypothetical protein